MKDAGHHQPEMHHAIGRCPEEEHAERQPRDMLLELDASVHRNKGVVFTAHALQELTVTDAGPATTDDGVDRMPG